MIHKGINYVIRLVKNRQYIKRNIFISRSARVVGCCFEKVGFNRIGHRTAISNCSVGKGTYLQENCYFVNTDFGRFCSIASGAKLVVGDHPTTKFVALHPAFYSGRSIAGLVFNHHSFTEEYKFVQGDRYCIIENDVWIGTDVIILGGVTIHNGAVIAAGAIVTKDVPPYAVVAGVPAKVIKYRFDEVQIQALLKIKWWEKDVEWIGDNIKKFDDIELFMNLVSE